METVIAVVLLIAVVVFGGIGLYGIRAERGMTPEQKRERRAKFQRSASTRSMMASHVEVTKSKKPTNHTLHLILTIITFGAWAPVWIFMALYHSVGPRNKSVTHHV